MSYKCQRVGLGYGAEGANLVTQTCGRKETACLVPPEREVRGLDFFFFLEVRTSVERLVMVANVGAKEFRKLCELCYIHRYYDSVVTNMNPHNIFSDIFVI